MIPLQAHYWIRKDFLSLQSDSQRLFPTPPLDTVQITGVASYPGTSLYKWAKENNYLLAKDWREWLTAQKEQRTLLSYPQMSSKDIDAYIDKGLKEFYLRPKQIWNMLISIRTFGDLLRKLHGFKAFVDYFYKKFTGQVKTDKTNPSEQQLINDILSREAVSL